MTNYSYKLATKKGLLKKGFISALTKKRAEKELSKDGSIVLFILNTDSYFWQKNIELPWFKFSEMEKVNFFRNLSLMSASGLSIVEALSISAVDIKSNKVRKTIGAMADSTRNGQKLSKVMEKYPEYFSQVVISAVHMGEVSGNFSKTLERISADMEKNAEIKRKIIGALVYPAIIISAMIAIVVLLLVYILPEIGSIYKEMGATMPLPTKIMLYIGNFLTTNYKISLLALFILIISPVFLLKIPKIHYVVDNLILKIPVFGDLIKEYNLVIFFRSAESLIKSGISMVKSVDIASKTIKNDVFEETFAAIHPILLRGVPFSDILIRFPFLFSIQTRKIIEVGERTGMVNQSFERITNYFEKDFDYKVKIMTMVIEPVLMLMLGVAVGIIAISVFLPIYQLAEVI